MFGEICFYIREHSATSEILMNLRVRDDFKGSIVQIACKTVQKD